MSASLGDLDEPGGDIFLGMLVGLIGSAALYGLIYLLAVICS